MPKRKVRLNGVTCSVRTCANTTKENTREKEHYLSFVLGLAVSRRRRWSARTGRYHAQNTNSSTRWFRWPTDHTAAKRNRADTSEPKPARTLPMQVLRECSRQINPSRDQQARKQETIRHYIPVGELCCAGRRRCDADHHGQQFYLTQDRRHRPAELPP